MAMGNPIWSVIIPAIFGLVSGVIGSLVAPWANWGVEKKKEQLKRRRQIVQRLRLDLDPRDKVTYQESLEYRYLRPFLSEQAIEVLEGGKVWARRPDSPNPLILAIQEGIKKLEKDWELI